MGYADNPHARGRPTRAARASSICASVRFVDDELETLALHVERTGFSRAELIREAIRRAGLFSDEWLDFPQHEPSGEVSESVTIRFTRPEMDALDRHVRRLVAKRARLIRGAVQAMGLFHRARLSMDPESEP